MVKILKTDSISIQAVKSMMLDAMKNKVLIIYTIYTVYITVFDSGKLLHLL
jgi:hypothetical protein